MEYEQGSTQRFYATFVDYKGEEATISGTPQITLMHLWGGNITYDVKEQNMTVLSGTTYYYDYNIPRAADRTTYMARYNAVYSGANLEITNAVGAFDFQVITKKFYDKKAGGMVQKLIKKDVWTKKEKEKIIETIEALSGRTMEDAKLVENRMNGFLVSLAEVSKELKDNISESDIAVTKDVVDNTRGIIKDLRAEVEVLQEKLEKQNSDTKGAVIKELKSLSYDDSHIVRKLVDLSRNISGLDTELRNERIGRVISELDDLKKGIDEFKGIYIKTVSAEVLEELDGENEGSNSE